MVQTYERGFMVCLSIGELVSIGEDKWRYRDWLKGEDGEKFWCIGFIPYEGIVDVDWEGDKYYDYPHVVCHFDQTHKQPYERIFAASGSSTRRRTSPKSWTSRPCGRPARSMA